MCSQAGLQPESGDLAPGFGVPWTVVNTLVTILYFLNKMLVLIPKVCAVSTGIPCFAKVRPTVLLFYGRPIVVSVFVDWKKSKEDCCFYEKRQKGKIEFSMFCRKSGATQHFPQNYFHLAASSRLSEKAEERLLWVWECSENFQCKLMVIASLSYAISYELF